MKPIFLTTLLLGFLVTSAQENWIEVYNANSESSPKKTCFINQSNIWGIEDGAIYFSDNGGANWELQFEKEDYNFFDLFFTDTLHGWVVGWSEVLYTSDGGINWELQILPNPLGLDVLAVHFINPDTGWIAGSYETIYGTYDGGHNWFVQQAYQLEEQLWLWDICFVNSQIGCAVGGRFFGDPQGIIFNTFDGGNTWIQHFPPMSEEFSSIQYINQDTIWAGDKSGRFYRSVDSGLSWELNTYFTDPGNNSIEDFHFYNNNRAIVSLGPWQWATTNNAWQDYEIINLGVYYRFRNFSFNSSNEGLASGYGDFWMTLDEGESWQHMNKKFFTLEFSSTTQGWMSTISPVSKLYKTTNCGYDWEEVNSPNDSPILGIDFISEQEGFYCTENGLIYKTSDQGNTWQNILVPTSISIIHKIQFLNSDTGYAIANNNILLKTSNGGETWDIFDNFQTDYLSDLHFLNGNWGSVVGSIGYTATTSNGGLNWNVNEVPETAPACVWYKDENNGFFLPHYSYLHFTNDGGNNWSQSDLSVSGGVDIAFSDFNTGWAVSKQFIHNTTDGGQSWNQEFEWSYLSNNERITGFSLINGESAFFCTSAGKVYAYDQTSSINLPAKESTIECFPNPTNGTTILSCDENFSGKEYLYLFDLSGKRINQFDYYYKSGDIVIDLSLLKKGIYILQTENFPQESIKLIKN